MTVLAKQVAFAMSVGLGAMALMSAAPALAVCDPASTDPSCPIGQLSLSNPANPASPLNMNNPANPASPFSLSNPANPASPLNPNNPANAQYQWAHSPNNPASPQYIPPPTANPYYRQPSVFDPRGILFGIGRPEPVGDTDAIGPVEPDVQAPRHRHRHRKHHTHLR